MNNNIYQNRIQNVIKRMSKHSLMVLFAPTEVMQSHDIAYPYRTSSDLLYLTGTNQKEIAMILHSDGEYYLFAEEDDPQMARWEGPRISLTDIAHKIGIHDDQYMQPYNKLNKQLYKHLQNKKTLYCSYGNSNYTNHLSLVTQHIHEAKQSSLAQDFHIKNIKNTYDIISRLRLIKDTFEISSMQKAADISVVAHQNLMSYTKKAIYNQDQLYEYQLKSFLENNFFNIGATNLAYPSIVATGNNATILHYTQGHSLVQSKDMLLIDAGCEYQGYASDITRTYPSTGKFTSAQKDIYELVLEAQNRAIALCVKQSNLKDIHEKTIHTLVDGLWEMQLFKKCWKNVFDPKKGMVSPSSKDEVIENKYYMNFYMHNTSHYLGLDVHDVGNYYTHKKPQPLQKNMVFTVEPGLYFPEDYDFIPSHYQGIGIRIEDDILITDKEPSILTKNLVKNVEDIEQWMS